MKWGAPLMLADLNKKEIEALRDNNLELNCLSMEVARQDGTRTYKGAGVVRQNEHGQLTFTLYDSTYADNITNVTYDICHAGTRAGKFLPNDQYYVLTAVDLRKRVWQSSRMSAIDAQPSQDNLGAVVTGILYELTCTNDFTAEWQQRVETEGKYRYQKVYYEYYFFGVIGDFPCNNSIDKKITIAGKTRESDGSFCVATFTTCGYQMELRREEGMAVLLIESNEPTSKCQENADVRFIEALQFVLGRPCHWQLFQISYGNKDIIAIRSKDKHPPPRLMPPLVFHVGKHFNEVWTLLYGKYLQFILPYEEKLWHPLTSRLFTIQHAASALWNTKMLVAGVEVEGLLNEQYADIVTPPENIIRSVDNVIALVEQNQSLADEEARKQIYNSLKYLKTPSAMNRLRKLIATNVVRKEDVVAWTHIRHKSAHAQRGETGMTEENSLRLDRVLVLFYHLIFHRIGYTGKYTDYGEYGWPEKDYPPK